MGNYSKGANGTISGKFGSVVGSSWRKVNYLRSLPKKSAKKASELQLAVQAKFTLSAAMLSPIKDILSLGFGDKKLGGLTGYNAAVRAFITTAIEGDYPDYTVSYPTMQLSKGTLAPLRQLHMLLEGNMLTINWIFIEKRGIHVDDKVIVVIYNKTSNLYDVEESAVRAGGTLSLELDGDVGDELHIWAFCVTRDERKVSPTQYLGKITLPELEAI
ncbi:DUF6266 family protein [Pedobacter insulae]|uniref:Uncharacterized protein n=1 Tax=Pedobacter insulae TaxID=414048 RepID=A0A1I2TBB3_9SPHI|nr:DUF6266 family protein [Pedobacter insulae]SFG62344.1 hypothetical protein SAMN04489864_101309 [Pedobacter insulae]